MTSSWHELPRSLEADGRLIAEDGKIHEAVGYEEMVSHVFLTDDRSAQRTTFSDGTTVTVNFGDRPYTLSDGITVEPLGHRVDGTFDTSGS